MASLPCGTLVQVSNGSFHGIRSAMPRTVGVSGNVPVRKGYKNAGSRWTARKVIEYTLVEYSFLECYIDKIHYTDYLSFKNLNKLFRLIPIPPTLGSRINVSLRILPAPPFNSFFTLKS